MNKVQILVIEDDIAVGNLITTTLEMENYQFRLAKTAKQGIMNVLSYNPDIMLLDLGLPDMDGLEVIKKVRSWSNIPIIVVSARSEDQDKVQALDLGADDYLTKPFSLKELLARLQALMRRPAVFRSNVLRCGDLELNTENRTLTKGGQEISLSPIELSLLELFMKHPQQFFSTDTLLARVWPSDKDSTDEAVRASIKRLRRKIDGANIDESESLIESNRRVGYRFRRRLD